MTHKLVTAPGFISGEDAYCDTCFDPDFVDGDWGAFEGIYNATDREIQDWFEEHKETNE